MKSVGELATVALKTAGTKGEGCADGAAQAEAWFAAHDAEREAAIFEARLQRLPDYLEESTFRDLLKGKGSSYPTSRKALAFFCKDDPAWTSVQPKIDAVMAPWMTEAP
jgi:hypothetical protein